MCASGRCCLAFQAFKLAYALDLPFGVGCCVFSVELYSWNGCWQFDKRELFPVLNLFSRYTLQRHGLDKQSRLISCFKKAFSNEISQ